MRIRIFRAATLTQAMAQIRAELGADALILSDRVRDGFVEVTAALEINDPPELRAPAQPRSAAQDLEPFVRPSRPRMPAAARDAPAPSAARSIEPSFLETTLAWHGLSPALIALLTAMPMEQACTRTFRYAPLPVGAEDDPLLLAGPPGSGKTLTVARLATRLVMAGQQPMVITADGKRAGAVEQLAAFTRLLGLTLVAANTPQMLNRAVGRREPGQPVLIDAPGLDLEDPAQAETLQGLLASSGASMALVLPCGLDPDEAQEMARAHAELGARTLVATRTDPSRRLGAVLCAAAAARLTLSEAGIGSGAADGLVPLTPAFLVQRLQHTGGFSAAAAPRNPLPATDPRPHGVEPTASPTSALPHHIAAQRRAASSP